MRIQTAPKSLLIPAKPGVSRQIAEKLHQPEKFVSSSRLIINGQAFLCLSILARETRQDAATILSLLSLLSISPVEVDILSHTNFDAAIQTEQLNILAKASEKETGKPISIIFSEEMPTACTAVSTEDETATISMNLPMLVQEKWDMETLLSHEIAHFLANYRGYHFYKLSNVAPNGNALSPDTISYLANHPNFLYQCFEWLDDLCSHIAVNHILCDFDYGNHIAIRYSTLHKYFREVIYTGLNHYREKRERIESSCHAPFLLALHSMDAVEIAEFLLFASEDDKKALGLFIQGEEDRHINPILSLIKNRIDMGRFYVSALSSIYPPAVYQALFEDILVHFGFRHYLKFDTEFLPDNTSFSNLLAVAKKELNSKNIWPALEILAKALTINPNCAEAKEMQTQIREDLLKTLENRGDSGRFGYAKLFELAKRFKVESEIKYWSHLLINSQA